MRKRLSLACAIATLLGACSSSQENVRSTSASAGGAGRMSNDAGVTVHAGGAAASGGVNPSGTGASSNGSGGRVIGGAPSAGAGGSSGSAGSGAVRSGSGGAGAGGNGAAGSSGHGGMDPGLDPEGYPIVNPSGCPSTEPTPNTPCPQVQLVCRYGDDLHCRSHWGCAQRCDPVCSQDLVWELGRPKRDCPGLCPNSEPREGDPCGTSELICTYGDQAACRTEWDCVNGHFVPVVRARDCQSAVCPETPVVTGSCSVEQITPLGGACVYKYGLSCFCNCIVDHGDPLGGLPPPPFQITWGCSYPLGGEAPSTCPLQIPTSGAPCQQNAPCTYFREGACTNTATVNATATCVSGHWQVSQR